MFVKVMPVQVCSLFFCEEAVCLWQRGTKNWESCSCKEEHPPSPNLPQAVETTQPGRPVCMQVKAVPVLRMALRVLASQMGGAVVLLGNTFKFPGN